MTAQQRMSGVWILQQGDRGCIYALSSNGAATEGQVTASSYDCDFPWGTATQWQATASELLLLDLAGETLAVLKPIGLVQFEGASVDGSSVQLTASSRSLSPENYAVTWMLYPAGAAPSPCMLSLTKRPIPGGWAITDIHNCPDLSYTRGLYGWSVEDLGAIRLFDRSGRTLVVLEPGPDDFQGDTPDGRVGFQTVIFD